MELRTANSAVLGAFDAAANAASAAVGTARTIVAVEGGLNELQPHPRILLRGRHKKVAGLYF
jgi:hypothetical protein